MQKLAPESEGSLQNLTSQLQNLQQQINQAITSRALQIRNNPDIEDAKKQALNDFIPAGLEAIHYISYHANSWLNLLENQKINATREAIAAYELILAIANDPNTPIKENELAILNGLSQHKLNSIICAPLAVLVCALLIVSSLIFMSLKTIAIISFTLNFALPIIAVALIVCAASAYHNITSYSEDKNLHKNLTRSLPTFFGKQPPKREKDSASNPQAKKETISL